jgi:hypothetical protein
MEPEPPHPLTLNVAVFSEANSYNNMILDKICGGRVRLNSSERNAFSALKMNSPVGPVQVDFTMIDMGVFLDVDDEDKASFPDERKVFDTAKSADFYLFLHDWKKLKSQTSAIDCMKKCNRIFDEETPKAVIGGNAESFIRKKIEKPVLPEFRQLVEDGNVAEFDFLSSSHDKGVGNFIPLVLRKVLPCDNMIESDGGLSHISINMTEKVLVPKASFDVTKLEIITVPFGGDLSLGRAELLKKSGFDRRISKDGHLSLHCSDNGIVAVMALNKTKLVITSPGYAPRMISHQDELVALEEGSELSIVPSLNHGPGHNEDMTYVLKSGIDAMKEASLMYKHKPAFILFPKLQEEKATTFNLQKIVRSHLTKIKEERMNAKALSLVVRRNVWLAADRNETSTIEEEDNGSSDEESFDAAEEEFYAATQDPVVELLAELDNLDF